MASILAATAKKEKSVPDRSIAVRERLARFHESNYKFTPAAELWAGLHNETGDLVCLNKMWCLARKAQKIGRHDVAEAIYLILHKKTKDDRYISLAMAAGERVPAPLKI